ncbi:MAG TPA: hypothetical protein VNI54_02880 [Thermoanaerobaculia bacterium]|nr:hypothetical protein [Thermoanaerobaculia bacterium]
MAQRELFDVLKDSGSEWTWRFWEKRSRRIARLQRNWEDLLAVVASRFENLLLQIYRGLDKRYAKSCSADEFVTLWSKPAMEGAGERARFACIRFWQAAEKAANQAFNAPPEAIASLKAKFMIRQFVEEIADATARETILSLAYEGRDTSPPDDNQLFRIIQAACAAFSDVLDDFSDIAERTDGVVTGEQLSNRDQAIERVRTWLFASW